MLNFYEIWVQNDVNASKKKIHYFHKIYAYELLL